MASFSSSFWRKSDGPHPAAWRASLLFDSEEAGICARHQSLDSFTWVGFLVPELKGGGEASEVEQADNVSNEALHVIGLHGSGDKISRYLQDWEVAGHAVPRNIRSVKETIFVRFLQEPVS